MFKRRVFREGFMRLKYVFIFCLLLLVSCIFNTETGQEQVESVFILSDTSDVEQNTFHENEAFEVIYSIHNRSKKTLSYHSGIPVVFFKIWQNDALVCSSTDYMGYAAILITGTIPPDSLLRFSWRAPNTSGRKSAQKIINLKAGLYEVEVLHPAFFDEYKLSQTKTLPLEIVP